MYLRPCFRQKDGTRHAYWKLVESYWTVRGPRQRVVSYLGEMDAQGRVGVRAGAEGKYQYELFEPLEPEWVEVDVKRVTVERKREFGGAWLGFEMCPSLGLPEFLTEIMKTGREDIPWPVMVLVLVIGRLGDPSNERDLAEHSFAASALGELLGVPADKINEDRLYRALDQLLPHKKKLEKHLKEKLANVVLPGLRSVALRRQQHVFRRISGGQRSGQTRLLTQTNAPTANRSISPCWSAVAACRSDTNCSRATGTT